MRVLVTGGSGFLGKCICSLLLEKGHEIVILDLVPQVVKCTQYFEGSLLNRDVIFSAVKGCDMVFHCAAMSNIEECVNNPVGAVETNILGLTMLLNESVKARIKRFMFASSVYVNSSLGGIYKSTKVAGESLIKEFHKYFNLNFTILRYGSLYGPGADQNNRILKYLTSAIEEGIIYHNGNGQETREFIHIKDAAYLSHLAMDKEYENKTVLLTGASPIICSTLFSMIEEILQKSVKVEYVETNDMHYSLTPYHLQYETVHKIKGHHLCDFGFGLMECCHEIMEEKIV